MYEIGNSLREARVRQGIDYPTAESGTRIRTRYLRAMEDEDFDLLPDPSYVRGFLRAYASYLGIDPALVLDEYESRYGVLAHALSPEGRRRAQRRAERGPRRREAQLLWLAIGGVAGVAVLTWLGIGGSAGPAPGTPTSTTATATAPAPVESVNLSFTGRGARGSYLEVRTSSATGATLYSGLLVPGATRAFTVPNQAWVRIGNPRLITVTLDGQPLAIQGGTGEFLITRDGATRVPGG
jgi:cytoskeletal protein RodZ